MEIILEKFEKNTKLSMKNEVWAFKEKFIKLYFNVFCGCRNKMTRKNNLV